MGTGPRALAANARPFRYGFYPVVALGFLLFEGPDLGQATAVALWCALWPPVADWVARRGDARSNLRLHLVEVALTGSLFALSGLSLSMLAAVCIILVMSNALQGGLRQAAMAMLWGAPGLAAGFAVLPPKEPFSATPAFAGALLLVYCVLVAHVAYSRVLATHGERAASRALSERLQQYLPHTLGRRLSATGRPSLERRWLVILFADLAGFTRMVERLQMEEVATVLDSYLQCIHNVTRGSGGAVSKLVGDGALMVFGEEGESSHRHLVGNALGCCRQLLGEFDKLTRDWRERGLPGEAGVKVGVASGYCSLGDWGGGGRLEYTVIGYPVNLASRLQDVGAAGDVVLCERTSLLADVPLAPVARRELKGLGEVPFRKVDWPACTPAGRDPGEPVVAPASPADVSD